ncbi:hypothetical protein LTR78_001869 [Recurvomyces mirabilis]|uniref:Uncharacterized protein n=1 Tax=Recurvomyces mirabilis TaxID=574656 RepID=A0AAE0WVH0_9PEZI|nr:hypothetical protein LTR78_001869 [Recurvomyces mirabilis]KAK5156691.1 hypothetical protein LTS14_004903 [Recurvomyces mirabilis]
MSGTLAGACDKAHWHEDTGIMVCNIYKALFSFTLFGFLSTAAALVLDIYVRRRQTKRGIYRLQDLDTKQPEASRGPYTDNNGEREVDHANEPRESLAWEEPRPSMGPYSEQGHQAEQQGFSDLGDMGNSRQGYAVPEAQFGYDTQYHGGHNEEPSKV